MKKYLLLLVITLGINVATFSQNYVGKTKQQITDVLDEKSIEYTTYYTKDGNEAIQYESEVEKRVYVIGVNNVCNWYIVLSNDDGFIYNMRKYATSKQFKQIRITEDYVFTYKKLTHKISIGSSPEDLREDIRSIFYGWYYFFVYSIEN